ncbi:MAG TPA: homoserine O-acetyltransferase [Chitinophagaceae bacterium]
MNFFVKVIHQAFTLRANSMEVFYYNQPFELEAGGVLQGLTIAYHTYGNLNADSSNVVWVCHALTASSNVTEWWPGVTGDGCVIDPARHFIVCANILGSCYGTSGPLNSNPETGRPYYSHFPFITIRDMVKAHILLRKHLEIKSIYLLAGGSMGGYQALEWCLMEKEVIQNLFLLATSATESPWGIAVHTAQRLAIEADATWKDESPHAGRKGLKAARGMGLLTYRNYDILLQKQRDPDLEKLDNYKASSYISYQGDKLVNRFNAYSYWLLTKAMDSHNIARGRGAEVATVLRSISQQTLIIGINSDILCPLHEQHLLADNLPNATLAEIDSAYGHDGFIIEAEKISHHLQQWLDNVAKPTV